MKLIRKYDTTTGKRELGLINPSEVVSNFFDGVGLSIADIYSKLTGNNINISIIHSEDGDRIEFEVTAGDGVTISDANIALNWERITDYYRGKSCCHTDLDWIYVSNNDTGYIGTDGILKNESLASAYYIHGDPCFYFKVHIQGEWGVNPDDNNASMDFTTHDFYLQFYTATTNQYGLDTGWSLAFSKKIDYVSGDTIVIDETFLIEADILTYVGVNYSIDYGTTFDSQVLPLETYDPDILGNYWQHLTITKCPKTSWFHRLEVPASDLDGNSTKQGILPNGIGEGLPFNGYYEVDIYCEVIEEVTAGDLNGNLVSPQIMELKGSGESFFHIDKSGRFVGVVPPNSDKFMNYSLQGSAIVYVNNESIALRNISYKITLPNGTLKQLTSGYCHVRYIGSQEGILRK